MCVIEGCDGKAVGKGLCAKHYMRLRRTGEPERKGKPGPRPSPISSYYRNMFPDWSSRTKDRYCQAMALFEGDEESMMSALRLASRPNGRVNVTRLLNIATFRYVRKHKDKL